MRLPGRTSRTPIGLDIGGRRIKAAQFNRSGSSWRITAAACVPRTASRATIEPAEVRRLRDLLREKAFKGTSVVLAVPSDKLLTGIMELPPRDSGAPIEQLTRVEMGRMHNRDPSSFEVACWELPRPARAANRTFVMGAACAHDDADALLDAFEGEGFEVDGLGVQACALARACEPLLDGVSGIAGILDIGWTASRLVLIYQGAVVYERGLAKGGLRVLAAPMAQQLGLDIDATERILESNGLPSGSEGPAVDFAAMMEEMRVPLSYVASQYPDAPLERLLLVGGLQLGYFHLQNPTDGKKIQFVLCCLFLQIF